MFSPSDLCSHSAAVTLSVEEDQSDQAIASSWMQAYMIGWSSDYLNVGCKQQVDNVFRGGCGGCRLGQSQQAAGLIDLSVLFNQTLDCAELLVR